MVRPAPEATAEVSVRARAGDDPDPNLGDYRIVREIGRGGMGVVHEAEQESLGRRVALKVLPPEALKHPMHVQRFQREARAAARLHHTNIVPVFGVGEENGTHYYAMQYSGLLHDGKTRHGLALGIVGGAFGIVRFLVVLVAFGLADRQGHG
jgi:hypothetical protein